MATVKMDLLEQAMALLANAPQSAFFGIEEQQWSRLRKDWMEEYAAALRHHITKQKNKRTAIGNAAVEEYQKKDRDAKIEWSAKHPWSPEPPETAQPDEPGSWVWVADKVEKEDPRLLHDKERQERQGVAKRKVNPHYDPATEEFDMPEGQDLIVDHRPRKRSACCGEALQAGTGWCMSCTSDSLLASADEDMALKLCPICNAGDGTHFKDCPRFVVPKVIDPVAITEKYAKIVDPTV